AFSFVIRHKVGLNNQVVNALSHPHLLITTMQIRLQGFDSFRGLYCDDLDFKEIWSKLDNGPFHQFSKLDGYLFKSARLCIPLCYLREATLLEGHAGGLAGHFERGFFRDVVHTTFPKLIVVIQVYILLLSVPIAPWEDVSLDFVLGLPHTQDNAKQWDLILPQAEFAYNRSVNHTTGKSPFETMYGRNPITSLDLVLVPEVGKFSEEGADQFKHIKELHQSYKGDSDDELDSGSIHFEEGEDDADTVNERVNVTNMLGAYFLQQISMANWAEICMVTRKWPNDRDSLFSTSLEKNQRALVRGSWSDNGEEDDVLARKELWERNQLLMQGTSLMKQEKECKLYDEFNKFAYKKGESLRDFYLRFSLLLNDMNIYNIKLEQFQENTKVLNTIPLEWSKFVTVFQKGDDLIDTINHMMSFLIAVVTSRYPPTNNQLRNSSNPRQQATINNGRVTVQQIQGRQNSLAAGTSRPYTSGPS
nr:RNA-directed DNA polymerase [Tanacetum cinerariifolium]